MAEIQLLLLPCILLLVLPLLVNAQDKTYRKTFRPTPYRLRSIDIQNMENVLRYEIYLQETVGGPLIRLAPEYQGTTNKKFNLNFAQRQLRLRGDLVIKIWSADKSKYFSLDLKVEHIDDDIDDFQTTIYGDPHVVLPIPGFAEPLCFEVTEKNRQVLEFLSLVKEGLVVNVRVHELDDKIVLRKRLRLKPETYISEVAILRGTSSVYVNTSHVIINNSTTITWGNVKETWRISELNPVFQEITIKRYSLSVQLNNEIRAIVTRHSADRLDIKFNNLYIGIPNDVQGILGAMAKRIERVRITVDGKGRDVAMLRVGKKEIQAESGRIGELKCWKLYNAMERVLGSEFEKYKLPRLFYSRIEKEESSVNPTRAAELTGGPMLLTSPPGRPDMKHLVIEQPSTILFEQDDDRKEKGNRFLKADQRKMEKNSSDLQSYTRQRSQENMDSESEMKDDN